VNILYRIIERSLHQAAAEIFINNTIMTKGAEQTREAHRSELNAPGRVQTSAQLHLGPRGQEHFLPGEAQRS
jgi:hypothetical protein